MSIEAELRYQTRLGSAFQPQMRTAFILNLQWAFYQVEDTSPLSSGVPLTLRELSTRCLIPWFDGAILSQEWKEALWDKFVTGAPRPRTLSELQ
ncbi:hypothetical protein [Paracoccus aestuarii]|uniref:hypothetical protein n=1 Tax=Paracoccus aestuarii TaxID=453842 RepID=UPI0014737C90|nr:hypothetical protein [Paracoccus aestuarii]